MKEFFSENQEKAWNSALALLNPTKAQLEHGLELHRDLFTMDHFCFLPTACWNHKIVTEWQNIKARNVGQYTLSKRIKYLGYDECYRDPACAAVFRNALKASGLKCTVQTVCEGKSRAEDMISLSFNTQLLREFRDVIAQAGSPDDIAAINKEGRTAVIWSVNGPPLFGELQDYEQEMYWIDTWYRFGVRLMHMSYNRRNFAADGCAEPADGGLSELGRDLIARLNKTGIIVDVPHTGHRSSVEAAKCSTKPIMASHTAAKALFDFIRCKDDDTLEAIAEGGGMVGVYAYAGMLGGSDDLAMMLNHIEYIAKRIGVDHVGIGTDLMYQHNWPEEVKNCRGYENAEWQGNFWWGNWKDYPHPPKKRGEDKWGSLAWTNWPLYTVGLVTRGFSDEDIAKILGGNFLRVFAATRPDYGY